jgi:ELWxxDGT repeat protein
MTIAGDRLFFSADSPEIGRELWALGGRSTARHRAARP